MTRTSHRFATILAADVVHFSSMMERDSDATVNALQNCRNLFQQQVSLHGGREFGSVGDSLMAEFPSPVEALRAAREVQSALARLDPMIDSSERLQVRIGLHAGDVIGDGENVFGDVVNTAARLQRIATPGGIVMSRLVHEQVHKEPGFAFRSLGKQPLKNIVEPVHAYEVVERGQARGLRRVQLFVARYKPAMAATLGVIVAGLLFVAYLETRDQRGISGTIEVPAANSIAVLPFRNLSPNEEDAYLADGIHADILTQLTKISTLDKVISRMSVERYRGTSKPGHVIAEELGVSTILGGDMQRIGDRIRISVQLIGADDDSHLWAETYDRDLTAADLFAVQSEISREIAGTLQLTLTAEESERIEVAPTANLEAYGEYVLGYSEYIKRTPESLDIAEGHFRRAITLDPNFALAYIGLVDTLEWQFEVDHRLIPQERWMPEYEALIHRALDIDPALGEAWASLGFQRMDQLKRDEAEQYFLKAIDLNPNYAYAHSWYAWLLANHFDRYDEALVHARRAVELDPNTPTHVWPLARALAQLDRLEESFAVLSVAAEKNPEFPRIYYEASRILGWLGRFGEALRWADVGLELNPYNVTFQRNRCNLQLLLNDMDATEQCLDAIVTVLPDAREEWVMRSHVYVIRRDFDNALQLLEKIASRDELAPWEQTHLAFFFLVLGDVQRATEILRRLDPAPFVDDNFVVSEENESVGLAAAHILYQAGDTDRADRLFEPILERFRNNRKAGDYLHQQVPLGIYAARQDKEKLVALLRESLDAGWRRAWFWLKYPGFDFMSDDPEWQALVGGLEAVLARQREWYEEHKDEPLF